MSSNTQTVVKDNSGSVELLEKGKGFFVVDILDAPSEKEIQKQIPNDPNLERMKNVFDLIDDELPTEQKSTEISENVNLDNIRFNGVNGRRSEISILASMLKVAKDGANKTTILYKANLSGRVLKNYLSFLISTGCIEEKPHEKKQILFHTTGKGNLFLFQWGKIVSLLETQ
jgi:predicted transcriptional regulator